MDTSRSHRLVQKYMLYFNVKSSEDVVWVICPLLGLTITPMFNHTTGQHARCTNIINTM